MANLYKVRDTAMDEFYVLADDDISAAVAYKDWVEDEDNGMDPADRLPVLHVNMVATQTPIPGSVWGPWANLIFGPMS